MTKEEQKNELPDKPKREYTPPVMEVVFLQMEQGIAAGSASASVTPGTTNGNVDPVKTDWEGTSDTTVDAPFFD
ncbi:hypothetical protein I6H88_20225 [Elizabethkingia bruuniana]|uniref:Uncharacterized protein n=1 Tax=Elizabethkingia bruuniana TaxID=1756149 RepID=A0A7T7ZXV6_9FLAO|nr:hypothetical protein [Elizabethkingia bruuniana]KGO09557.1 hypothetical protein KS04_13830 [Elizabethkingia miricola]AQX85228.1 hypothetical protein AYC65_09500 [Elizabethkingia bruuniana]KUY28585.1 hypothetical protein ATB97_00170 [Elizabethkingia bruuniana]OPB70217.1 hypothetical protein BAY12_16280 [Elizabethkingia bruuniana]QQN58722.1 hypothetical protein I6H88_20225 [Elizabethkingia bruuniana]